MNSRDGDNVRYVGGRPLSHMSESIAELRRLSFDALADELTALKEKWARAVMHYAEGRDAAAKAHPPLEVAPPVLRPLVPAPRPKLTLVVAGKAQVLPPPQRAGSRARELPQGDAS